MSSPLSSRPPPARSPLGRRGHRFPRSHGPPERKIKATWLTLRCPANPRRSSAQTAPARPARGARGRDAEGTREPQESARNRRTCRRAKRRRIGAGPAPRQSMLTDTPKEPESRRNPGEFADHDAEERLVCRRRGWPVVRLARALRRQHASEKTEGTLSCGNVAWRWGAGPVHGAGDRKEPRDLSPFLSVIPPRCSSEPERLVGASP